MNHPDLHDTPASSPHPIDFLGSGQPVANIVQCGLLPQRIETQLLNTTSRRGATVWMNLLKFGRLPTVLAWSSLPQF